MRIAVIGAGAVGCYYGGLLARAGHEVTLVGRPSHVEAINARGLLLEAQSFTAHVPVEAVTEIARIERPELVLFCVKSGDTETAGAALKVRLAPQAVVLSLQNGYDNAERLARVLGQPVVAAVVYVGTEMAGPGHVKHHGRGELLIGASPRSEEIARLLTDAEIPTNVAARIEEALWVKLIINCAYNALSAVGPIAYGPMLETDGAREVITSAVHECLAVAKASGVAVPADTMARILALGATMPTQQSSTAQDLARGRPSEIDFLNGYVVRKGADLGVATPTNRALQVVVKLAEKGRKLAAAPR